MKDSIFRDGSGGPIKRSIFVIALSMTAAIPLVNASAEDLPIGNHKESAVLKDSVKGKTNELSQLIALLMKTGDEEQLSEGLSNIIGLSGTPPIKGRDFTVPHKEGKERRECTIVFADASGENGPSAARRPSCIYIQHKIVAGNDSEAFYYRFSPDGKLEYASVNRSKYDDDGKIIPGSGIATTKDINSPEVQGAFKAELAYWTRDWAKAQKKALAHSASDSAASSAK